MRDDNRDRFPPRRTDGKIPPGQSYVELFEKHGRPFGPFDKERQLPYSAARRPLNKNRSDTDL